jgi:hypothetical protein
MRGEEPIRIALTLSGPTSPPARSRVAADVGRYPGQNCDGSAG